MPDHPLHDVEGRAEHRRRRCTGAASGAPGRRSARARRSPGARAPCRARWPARRPVGGRRRMTASSGGTAVRRHHVGEVRHARGDELDGHRAPALVVQRGGQIRAHDGRISTHGSRHGGRVTSGAPRPRRPDRSGSGTSSRRRAQTGPHGVGGLPVHSRPPSTRTAAGGPTRNQPVATAAGQIDGAHPAPGSDERARRPREPGGRAPHGHRLRRPAPQRGRRARRGLARGAQGAACRGAVRVGRRRRDRLQREPRAARRRPVRRGADRPRAAQAGGRVHLLALLPGAAPQPARRHPRRPAVLPRLRLPDGTDRLARGRDRREGHR